jgi:hypothetical protein
MTNISGWWAVSVVYALALGGSIFANAVWAAMPEASCPADQERLEVAYRKLPLHFEVNQGQAEGTVKFLAQGRGYSLSLTPSEAVLNLYKPLSESPRQAGTSAVIPPSTAVVRMQLVGSAPAPEIAGEQPLPGKSHYLIGRDPGKWRTNIPHYARVRYRSVYPGIDLVYYGQQGQLEYDFVVAPGADPKQIRLDIQGAEKLYLDAAGNLVVRVAGGEVIQQVPKVYQQVDDKRQAIPGRYVLANNQIGFEVGTYEATRPLVIDPVMCAPSGEGESSRDIAVDPQGQIYMTGLIGGQVFVTKLAADRQPVYHCVFSGSGAQESTAIAVDRQGRAYVTGWTDSTDFPTMNPIQGTLAGVKDAFIVRLSADGQVEYSTYLGGLGFDTARSIAVRKGRAYVTGETDSTNFPTFPANPLQGSVRGGIDTFVAKLTKNGQRLAYSTYLGGSGLDTGRSIAVRKGQAYVIGETDSTDFPANLLPGSVRGGIDVFVAKLAKNGQMLMYSKYLGGSRRDRAKGIAVRKDQAYVAGNTNSTDFPAKPLQGTRGKRRGPIGGVDVFVTKLAQDGQEPVYSESLGGSGNDRVEGIDVDPEGQVYLIGSTGSSEDFPTEKPVQGTFGGGERDAFVAKLTEDGQKLVYSTYLGGTGNEKGQDLDVDSKGEVQATITTTETEAAMDNINNAPPDPVPVTDAEASPVGDGGSGDGSLIVTVQEDVAPNIAVKKNANPTSVPASGGSVTYSVMVTNNTTEALTLTSLRDDQFGDLNNTCAVPRSLAANDTHSCSFQQSLSGEPATEHVNTVTATAENNAGTLTDAATDKATVSFIGQQAQLTVTKNVVNNEGGTKDVPDFPLFVDGDSVKSGVQNTFDAGAHTVSETNQPGYTATIGGDCAADGTITLNPGDVKTCTITNDDQAPGPPPGEPPPGEPPPGEPPPAEPPPAEPPPAEPPPAEPPPGEPPPAEPPPAEPPPAEPPPAEPPPAEPPPGEPPPAEPPPGEPPPGEPPPGEPPPAEPPPGEPPPAEPPPEEPPPPG